MPHKWLAQFLQSNRYERRKLILLSACFFFVVGAYSILRPLKSSIFAHLVGAEYQPYTKFISILVTIPGMLFYSFLIDRLRRHQVFYFFIALYCLLGVAFTFLMGHSVYGVESTASSPYNILGWIFYIYMDLFPIFIVTTFWAFSNSINTNMSAKRDYGIIVATSKLGGVLLPYLSLFILGHQATGGNIKIPLLILFSIALLVAAGLFMTLLIKTVPQKYLHGYEAVYQLERETQKTKKRTGMLEGIKLMLTEPYVFGIFILVYSYEIVAAMIDYHMQLMVQTHYQGEIVGMTSFNLWYTIAWQGLGIIFALLGTSTLLNLLGIRFCLVSVPIIIAGCFGVIYLVPSLFVIVAAMIIFRAINYGFNQPIREILYIPTVNDIKFKSKGWIDSFGRTLSKTSGAAVNLLSTGGTYASGLATSCGFAFCISAVWVVTAILIAKKYDKTIETDTVIGHE